MSHEGDPRYAQTTPELQKVADRTEALARMLAANQDDVPQETAWPYYIGDAREILNSGLLSAIKADAWDQGRNEANAEWLRHVYEYDESETGPVTFEGLVDQHTSIAVSRLANPYAEQERGSYPPEKGEAR